MDQLLEQANRLLQNIKIPWTFCGGYALDSVSYTHLGFTDYSATLMDVDTNGDGIADSVFFGEDANGDTVFETTQIMDAEEWAMFTGSPDSGYVPVDEGGGFDAGYEQFNPAETDMSQVVGTPAADEQCWDYQGESGPCAIYAQVMAYEGDVYKRQIWTITRDSPIYMGRSLSP